MAPPRELARCAPAPDRRVAHLHRCVNAGIGTQYHVLHGIEVDHAKPAVCLTSSGVGPLRSGAVLDPEGRSSSSTLARRRAALACAKSVPPNPAPPKPSPSKPAACPQPGCGCCPACCVGCRCSPGRRCGGRSSGCRSDCSQSEACCQLEGSCVAGRGGCCGAGCCSAISKENCGVAAAAVGWVERGGAAGCLLPPGGVAAVCCACCGCCCGWLAGRRRVTRLPPSGPAAYVPKHLFRLVQCHT